MTTAERLRREGKREGKREGLQEGSARILIAQLRRRFGEVDDATADRVKRASVAELDRWAERILTAASLEDVLGEPGGRRGSKG